MISLSLLKNDYYLFLLVDFLEISRGYRHIFPLLNSQYKGEEQLILKGSTGCVLLGKGKSHIWKCEFTVKNVILCYNVIHLGLEEDRQQRISRLIPSLKVGEPSTWTSLVYRTICNKYLILTGCGSLALSSVNILPTDLRWGQSGEQGKNDWRQDSGVLDFSQMLLQF